MSEVGFYLANKRDKTSIDIIIRFRGRRYKIPTGESVVRKFWNAEKQRAKVSIHYKDCDYINNRLNDIETACLDALKEIRLFPALPTQQELRSIVEAKMKSHGHIISKAGFLDYCKKHVAQIVRSKNTLKRYTTTLNKLAEFEKDTSTRITFDIMNMDLYNRMQSYFYSQGMSVNYFGDIIKNIKIFFHAAREAGVHDYDLPRKFREVSEDSDSVYLSTDELTKLNNLVINEDLILDHYDLKVLNVKGNMQRLIDSLQDCRDRFLIGAYTAMRFSDYSHLTGLKHTDSVISRKSEKTGIVTVIPMHPVIREILRRRGDKIPRPVSNQKMNKQLKKLCEIAGIEDPVEVTITKGGVKKRTTYKKYELITTHTARRSGCTNMYLSGIDPLSIMVFSGHRTMKSFMKYIKASPVETAERLKDHPFFK